MLDASLVLILERVDAMVLAAMQGGDEGASYDGAREHLYGMLDEPLLRGKALSRDEVEQRMALGLSTS